MRVFMLGWEFPPFISGGLGTACYGLTKALSQAGHDVTFVLPKVVGAEYTEHVKLLSPQSVSDEHPGLHEVDAGDASSTEKSVGEIASTFAYDGSDAAGFEHVTFKAVPSRLFSPYARPEDLKARPGTKPSSGVAALEEGGDPGAVGHGHVSQGAPGEFDGDMVQEAYRYASFALRLAADQMAQGGFDVVHAHDWMTVPAGIAIAERFNKPLVLHIHSTEYDRAGDFIDGRIADLERNGCQKANRVIAVSKYTRSVIAGRYHVEPDKIDVVYNGIDDQDNVPPSSGFLPPKNGYHTVLYLGRITMQKGPEYFIKAAKRVLEKLPDTRFVMAGSGDKVHDVIELAAREGVGHRVFFTGFLRGADVDRAFGMADVYVMPSVSEPFGISALEAIRADVPVIVSKQSGVAEVIDSALKVDFWDVHAMAENIIAVLNRPPLASTLKSGADRELKKLSWGEAAARSVASYEAALVSS